MSRTVDAQPSASAPTARARLTAFVALTGGRPLNRGDVAMAAVVGIGAALFSIVYRAVLVPTDPWNYVQAALDFPDHEWNVAGLIRYGMILPLLPFAEVFGESQVTYYTSTTASSFLLLASVFLLGARGSGRPAGLVASVTLLALPVVQLYLSRGYPDIPGTALLGAALVAALTARDRAAETGRSPAWLLLATGFLLGWAFEARETAIFGMAAVALVLLAVRPRLRTAILVAMPLAAWAMLDIGLSAALYGDPLLRVNVLLGSDINQSTSAFDQFYRGQTFNWYLGRLPISMLAYAGGVLMVGLIAGAGVAALWKRSFSALYAIWAFVPAAMLVLLGGVLDPSAPSVRVDVPRYWLAFLPGAVLAVAVAITPPARDLLRGLRLVPPLALVVGSWWVGWVHLTGAPTFAPNGGDALENLRTYFAAQGADPDRRVFSDWRTDRLLPAYTVTPTGQPAFEAKSRSLTGPEQVGSGDYVLIFSADDSTCWACRIAIDEWLRDNEQLLAQWSLEFATPEGNLELYRVP